MSNYQSIGYEDASDELRLIYDEIREAIGETELPNWITYMGEMPHIVKGSWALLKSVLMDGNLPPLLQDLILFVVAYHRTVPYCMALHASNIIRMTDNLTLSDLEEIAQGKSRGYLPEKYSVATAVALKLATSKCILKKQDFDQLSEAGFDRSQSLEITMLVSVSMFLNTYTFAAGMPIEPSVEKDLERTRRFKSTH